MHVFLIIVAIILVLLMLRFIKAIGFVLIFGIAYLLDNFLKVIWWIITAPFLLCWWIICAPFRVVGFIVYKIVGLRWDFWWSVKRFYRHGDWSERTAKVLVSAAVGAGIGATIAHYVDFVVVEQHIRSFANWAVTLFHHFVK